MRDMVRVVRWSELSTWSPSFESSEPDGPWPWVRLDSLIRLVTEKDGPKNQHEPIGLAGVRWYGQGVFERERRAPERLSGKYTSLIPGALVYNRLFAWKQSFAVVPPETGYLFVSNEFPQFLSRTEEFSLDYAALILSSQYFAPRIFERSSGTTAVSRNRLKEDAFLKLSVPVPPRNIQDDLVRRTYDLLKRAEADMADAAELQKEAWNSFESALGVDAEETLDLSPKSFVVQFKDCLRWDTDAARRTKDAQTRVGSDWVTLDEVSVVSGGIQKSPANRPGLLSRPYLRVANIQKGKLDLSEIKYIDVPAERLDRLRLEAGDLLFVEGNGSADEIGRSALWTGEIPDCVHQNHLIKVRITDSRLLPLFALSWFNCRIGRRHFAERARTTSGLHTLNLGDIRSAPLPLPPVQTQKLLAEALWNRLDEAEALSMRAVDFRTSVRDAVVQEIFETKTESEVGEDSALAV